MQQEEALTVIGDALGKVLEDPAAITINTDLVEEDILDSLDGMVFMLEVETACGKKLPEDIDLVDEGYYKVEKLVEFMCS